MIRRLLLGLFIIGVLAAALLAADVARFFLNPLANDQPEHIQIEPGTSFRVLAHRLRAKHIIRNARDEYYLSWYARLSGQATSIKSGEYQVPAHPEPAALIDLLVSGEIRQHKLTLVEGWRFSEIMNAIDRNPALDHTLKDASDEQIMAAIGHPGQKPEGRFMPDTYMFPRGLTDVAFLKRAYQAMQHFLSDAWAERADDIEVDTPYEALILASIVEKETAVADERSRVAGVFTRRLRKGMRLQTDPTVIYGMSDYDGNIRKADLRRDTPYNTYTRSGLPPTPIAAPSRASIRAVLHPGSGTALYFVSRGDGTHVFSDTLAEQNRAVRQYQRSGQ